MIRQFFAPYTQWEDWQNGMYRDVGRTEHESMVANAAKLLSNAESLKNAMTRAVNDWPISAAVNLTDQTKNHRPWLGQAACCIEFGCTETSVREAWNSIGADLQRIANKQADDVFSIFCETVDDTKQLSFRFSDAS
jgi:hypothetical protein